MGQASYVFHSPRYLAREIEIGLGDGKWTTTMPEIVQAIILGIFAYLTPVILLHASSLISGLIAVAASCGWFLIGMLLRRLYGPAYMFEIRMRLGLSGGPGVWDRQGRTRCSWARVRRRSPFRGPAPLAPLWPEQRWSGPLGMGVRPSTATGSFVAGRSLVKHLERKL